MSTILAFGAWLKNAACLRDAGGRVRWSPLHGDLGTPAACAALEASVEALLAEAGGRVDAVAHDLHPDFHSTRLALAVAQRLGMPAVAVQHHHAHVAVVLAEQAIDEPVIGLALDGVGLGSDGTAWGGELLAVSGEGWQRVGHLWPLALPGGDAAAREPWRMAAAALHAMGRGAEIEARLSPPAGAAAARGIAMLLARGLHCPPTTSAGRWFDAAAGALGLCTRQAFEAEAAIALEAAAARWLAEHAAPATEPWFVESNGVIDLRPVLAACFDAEDVGAAAALFHLVLADALVRAAARAAAARAIGSVVLGGGCFFNTLLAARVTAGLESAGLRVLRPRALSCGDASLALGQAWVAAQALANAEPKTEAAACA